MDYPTLGGAIATSVHGTGTRFGSMSAGVSGLTLVTPSGEVIDCSATSNPEIFQAARCSVGALGVASEVTLQNQASFRLTETNRVEPIFWKYEGRPHWGKLHTLDAKQLKRLYPHWQDFMEVRQALDPAGRMLNSHLKVLFA